MTIARQASLNNRLEFPMYDDALPFTGAGLAVGGTFIGLPAVLGIAAAAILFGIGVIRVATRGRRRAPSQD